MMGAVYRVQILSGKEYSNLSPYNVALFFHISGIIGVFIATAIEIIILFRMRSAQTVAQVREWVSVDAPLGTVFSVLTLLILAAGIYMLFNGGWNLTLPWVDVSFIALILMNVVGAAISSRRFTAIHHTIGDVHDGPVSEELFRQINDPILWTSVFSVAMMLVGIVYLMTLKPGWLGTSVVTIAAIALGFALGQLPRRLTVLTSAEA